MKKDYSGYTCEELRDLILSGALGHIFLTKEIYERLYDYELLLEEPSDFILEFCITGFKRFRTPIVNYNKPLPDYSLNVDAIIERLERGLDDINEQHNYSELPDKELRELYLKDELNHEQMSKADYERLLDSEVKIDFEHTLVVTSCVSELKKYGEYKKFNDMEIYNLSVNRVGEQIMVNKKRKYIKLKNAVKENKRKNRKKSDLLFEKHNFAASFIYVFIITFLIGGVVYGVGHGVVALGKKIFDEPEKTLIINYKDMDVTHSSDFRTYSSMKKMLKAENLKILYPEKLPDGYEFTEFEVSDRGDDLKILAYCHEPYLSFKVEVGTSQIAPEGHIFPYEANNIKYDINEMDDGLYQAYWFNDGDYYEIVVSDKAILSEIINNLK